MLFNRVHFEAGGISEHIFISSYFYNCYQDLESVHMAQYVVFVVKYKVDYGCYNLR